MAKEKGRIESIADFILFILNNPSEFEITPDKGGWTSNADLIPKMQKKGYSLAKEDISKAFSDSDERKIFSFVCGRSFIKPNKKSKAKIEDFDQFKVIK